MIVYDYVSLMATRKGWLNRIIKKFKKGVFKYTKLCINELLGETS